MSNSSFSSGILILLVIQLVSGAVLDHFFSDSSSCEQHCDEKFSDSADLKTSCSEGCRLFNIIGLAKGYNNKTAELCFSACSEAFTNGTVASSCNHGCRRVGNSKYKEDNSQTLHLLTPMFYIKSAYNSMAHHVRQFISTSWTVYVQEDSGKMVVLQTNNKPKVERIEDVKTRQREEEKRNFLRNFKPPWEPEKIDWMDCISHQSGIPRWLLVIVLFGFILALLWLCCATAVTAPNHYMTSSKHKKNVGYVLVCEPNQDLKHPPPLINTDEEAPPLPPKVSLI